MSAHTSMLFSTFKKVNAIPPPMIISFTWSNMLLISWILSLTLALKITDQLRMPREDAASFSLQIYINNASAVSSLTRVGRITQNTCLSHSCSWDNACHTKFSHRHFKNGGRGLKKLTGQKQIQVPRINKRILYPLLHFF